MIRKKNKDLLTFIQFNEKRTSKIQQFRVDRRPIESWDTIR